MYAETRLLTTDVGQIAMAAAGKMLGVCQATVHAALAAIIEFLLQASSILAVEPCSC